MDSKPEEQRAVKQILLLEGEKPCHVFQKLQKSFSKACISFKWQLLPHPPYSQDLELRYFYLFLEVVAVMVPKP